VLQEATGGLFRVREGAVGCQFQSDVSRFPMPGEWHGAADSVMPVWHDVHRTRGAAFVADETPTDRRPGQVQGQGSQPDVDHPSIAFAARALDVAGHVTVGDPFSPVCQAGKCLSIVSVAAKPLRMIPRPTTLQIIIALGIERRRTTEWVWTSIGSEGRLLKQGVGYVFQSHRWRRARQRRAR
jgi:hypothetical protein